MAMNSPSPDSEAKLQKRVNQLQSQIQTLEAASRTAQKEWAALKRRVASDTEVTIQSSREAIETATAEAKDALISLQAEGDRLRDNLKTEQKGFEVLRKSYLEENATLERDNKVLQVTHATLQEQNTTLASEIEVRGDAVANLKRTEEALTGQIAELHIQDEQASDKLVAIRKECEDFDSRLSALSMQYDENMAKFIREIDLLELKKEALEREIIENRANDDAVRENLAKWQKTLDEKDDNLRIREARVNQQEKAIARNYNLLNL